MDAFVYLLGGWRGDRWLIGEDRLLESHSYWFIVEQHKSSPSTPEGAVLSVLVHRVYTIPDPHNLPGELHYFRRMFLLRMEDWAKKL